MHKTSAGEKRKAMKREARELEREAKALARASKLEPVRKIRQEEADGLKAEAEALKDRVRLEDLHIWQMEKEKTTKKGSRKYTYWMASWHEDDKVQNVHLGSSRKMDANAAGEKARKMKAEALGLCPLG